MSDEGNGYVWAFVACATFLSLSHTYTDVYVCLRVSQYYVAMDLTIIEQISVNAFCHMQTNKVKCKRKPYPKNQQNQMEVKGGEGKKAETNKQATTTRAIANTQISRLYLRLIFHIWFLFKALQRNENSARQSSNSSCNGGT